MNCTFVTVLPARKKVASSTKKTPHGCTACAIAVKKAVAMPAGVRDLWDQARYTRTAMHGIAIIGFIVDAGTEVGSCPGVRAGGVVAPASQAAMWRDWRDAAIRTLLLGNDHHPRRTWLLSR